MGFDLVTLFPCTSPHLFPLDSRERQYVCSLHVVADSCPCPEAGPFQHAQNLSAQCADKPALWLWPSSCLAPLLRLSTHTSLIAYNTWFLLTLPFRGGSLG